MDVFVPSGSVPHDVSYFSFLFSLFTHVVAVMERIHYMPLPRAQIVEMHDRHLSRRSREVDSATLWTSGRGILLDHQSLTPRLLNVRITHRNHAQLGGPSTFHIKSGRHHSHPLQTRFEWIGHPANTFSPLESQT